MCKYTNFSRKGLTYIYGYYQKYLFLGIALGVVIWIFFVLLQPKSESKIVMHLRFCLLLAFFSQIVIANAQRHSINLNVKEKSTGEPVVMVTCKLEPIGIYAVTDMDGKATLKNIPEGQYTLVATYVGFEPIRQPLKVTKSLTLQLRMTESNLALKEVTVTARQNASGTSTSSIIGRQAIDHLQATSLADVMQLIPGHLMGNTDMTAQQNLQIRQLSNSSTAAFGSSVCFPLESPPQCVMLDGFQAWP